MNQTAPRSLWASRLGFILAAAGSAVGLGNIWKFPYVVGENGGGAFVLVYLACILLVGLPIMMAEFMLGRHTRRDAVGAFVQLEGKRSPWIAAGWVSITAAFLILSYYSVVAGWTLDYVYRALRGSFSGVPAATIEGMFDGLIADGPRQILWHLVFICLCLGIVIGGVQKGIERWSKILMPILLALLALLFMNGMLSKGAWEGIAFMFRPDFEKLTAGSVLEAMGHAFFTLSLGMAAMITYGSYIKRNEDLLGSSLRIVGLDVTIALMAGLAIFPIVFSVGMEPGAGPGLIFKTIPVVFSRIPGGFVLAILFFLLLSFAALTSAISLLEAQVAYLIDERGWGRKRATALLAGLAFLVGLPTALSYNSLAQWHLIGERTFFDSADLLTSNYLLPISGLLISIYVGWFWSGSEEKQELVAGGSGWVYPLWHFLIRYIAPSAIAIVLFFKMRETGLFAWFGNLF
ncbi:neurotransmitter:Na+ symporter, NSS family [Geoalkalibacter ferrihydriticus]|uniref:Transporter n=2 Tax=Geoalkalibacter ferrihydriticus TaxID=392333 RepID=A0A0C2HTY2_9BACT|nr:sodium-dependent transporter [Geoalkalibacter ferrihydriticus]KIH76292.1 Na+-dependent transporter [Geoalkalibacter ferrihydriticus DSM 17813]SDL22450.1 neurotransmitter:Na+ symporter, NSS family [Geoalkalibacter ferrihydriticus]